MGYTQPLGNFLGLKRKRIYGRRQEILNHRNCKTELLTMFDSQIARAVDRYLAPDYSAESFREFVANRLNAEFEEGDFLHAGFEDATWTIDRAVETGGLLLLRWRLQPHADAAGQVVDSYFRILDPTERARVSASIRTEAAGALRPAAHDESEA